MPLTCAHLVGSLPYPDADTAFAEIAARLGGHLKRIPDGETGERARWIFWQRARVADHAAMEVGGGRGQGADPPMGRQADPRMGAVPLPRGRSIRRRSSSTPAMRRRRSPHTTASSRCAARESCRTGSASRSACRRRWRSATGSSRLPPGPISSPPTSAASNPTSRRSAPRFRTTTWRSSGTSARRCWPGRAISRTGRPRYKQDIAGMLFRLGNAVPEPAELGYHLCYGTPNDEHVVMPKDLANAVEIVHAILGGLERSLQFVHVPAPKHRGRRGLLRAARGVLALPEGCELYLGVIHHDDREGDKRRIAAATQTVSELRHRHRMRLGPRRPGTRAGPARQPPDRARRGLNLAAPAVISCCRARPVRSDRTEAWRP